MRAKRRDLWTGIGVILLILACSPASRTLGFAGGRGEPNDPYQIATVADLLAINSDPNLPKKSFVLLNDLDLDPNLPGGRVFTDAVVRPFWGTFDGRGHTIRHLCVSAKPGLSAALFGSVHGLIKDLHLEEVQINGSSCGGLASFTPGGTILHCSVTGKVTGSHEVGGLIGNGWDAKILNCESQAEVSGSSHVGGLVGHTISGAHIGDCRASGTVTGTTFVGGLLGGGSGTTITGCRAEGKVMGVDQVGGLAGNISFRSTLVRCESRADVSAASNVGGLAGQLDGQVVECRAAGTITGADAVGGLVGDCGVAAIRNCAAVCQVTAQEAAGGLVGGLHGFVAVLDSYARGSVTGAVVGGLVGNATIIGFSNCLVNNYAACEVLALRGDKQAAVAGGLFGKADLARESLFRMTGCYWDTDVAKVLRAAGSGSACYGTGLTTQPMQQQDTFEQAGWDFASTWTMEENGYPVLRWEVARDAK